MRPRRNVVVGALVVLASVGTWGADSTLAVTPPTAPVGSWVPDGWTAADVEMMGQLVYAELLERGLTAEFNLVEGHVNVSSGGSMRLVTLAQTLDATDPAEWAAVVELYVNSLLDATATAATSDYAVLAPTLRIRVGELAAIGLPPGSALARPLAGDLMACVVLDQPETISYTQPNAASVWGVTEDEIFLTAVSQTLSPSANPEIAPNGEVSIFDDFYAASRILDPTTVVDQVGPDGLIISIPNSNVFIATPVAAVDLPTLIQFDILNHQDYAQLPVPASDEMYWWHDGVLEVITSENQQLRLPPDLDTIISGTAGKLGADLRS